MRVRATETLFLRLVSVALIALGGAVIIIAAAHASLGALAGIPIIVVGVALAVMSTNQLGNRSDFEGFGLHLHRDRENVRSHSEQRAQAEEDPKE